MLRSVQVIKKKCCSKADPTCGPINDIEKAIARRYSDMSTEKRKFKRYVFPNNNKITALLALGNGNKRFEARILNISEGGIGLAVDRTRLDGVAENTVLFLKEISGEKRITRLTGHAVKVKWILDYKPLNNLAIGCEFISLNDECRIDIESLLNPGNV